MSETVLVTGGFGLVGSETVKRLAADGRNVVATDLATPANRNKAQALPSGVQVYTRAGHPPGIPPLWRLL